MKISYHMGYWRAIALYKDGTRIKRYYPYIIDIAEKQKNDIEHKLIEKEGCVFHRVTYVDEKI